MSKWILAALLVACHSAFAQNPQDAVNRLLFESLAPINKCYHGMSTSDPCFENVTLIASSIWGQWQAINDDGQPIPWSIEFHPNGMFDLQNGTLTMTTSGPSRHGTYRIVPVGNDEHPTIYVVLDNGQRYQAHITLYSLRELLLIDSGTTTYFHRVL